MPNESVVVNVSDTSEINITCARCGHFIGTLMAGVPERCRRCAARGTPYNPEDAKWVEFIKDLLNRLDYARDNGAELPYRIELEFRRHDLRKS